MSRYDLLLAPTDPPPASVRGVAVPPAEVPARELPADRPLGHLPDEPTHSATDPPLAQSTDQSTGRSTERPSGQVVPRPKAFYITRRLDRRLDAAVRYIQEVQGIARADRSTVVNALLDREDLFTDESLERLAARVVAQLTSRLTR